MFTVLFFAISPSPITTIAEARPSDRNAKSRSRRSVSGNISVKWDLNAPSRSTAKAAKGVLFELKYSGVRSTIELEILTGARYVRARAELLRRIVFVISASVLTVSILDTKSK